MAISTSPANSTAKLPEFLVSAASMEEFDLLATISQVDIIDLKDPAWGAISPASIDLWNLVAAKSSQLPKHQHLSAALGEFDQANQCAKQLPPQFRFAKMGSSECDHVDLLMQRWRTIKNHLHASTELVAVAYADFKSAKSIDPMKVLLGAKAGGLKRILIDTFQKDGRTSIDHLGIDQLRAFADAAYENGIWWSLAGSIDLAQVDQLSLNGIHPDCIGVRGAVCDGGRSTSLSEEKCRRFSSTVHGHAT
ncbi:hypothetical protein LF1_25570 [Rubripirellula obstinata]|uniref:(5-formylfuran-3-yl)methyl phosphate synthase n=2 Tax=Rubripirellula obstinata TaxID=406547 RepID=A0A5B1CJX2_9BACT|nr:(5-formylfuran-3-yl)methyl phosphate synthase [Rubripirellula obstinata]KAA1260019.1 hypothetical protein LF1_25570 [Rubripirellula obstinata]